MANVKIKQLPSGNYNAMVFHFTDSQGKRHYKSITAPSKREVKQQIAVFLANRESKTSDKSLTLLDDAITHYINTRRNTCSPSTIAGYEKMQRNYFHNLKKRKIGTITQEEIQELINEEAANFSSKSLENRYSFLASVIKSFLPDSHFNLHYPQKKKVIKRLPEPNIIYNIVKGTDIEVPILLAMWLSLRMSEVRGLKYSDISNGYITVQNTILDIDNVPTERDLTKTYESTRLHRLPQYLIDLIGTGEGHVVKMTANTITKRFYRLLDKAGVDHISFHDLRHICASVMVKLGIPDIYAMERGGWSSNQVLKRVYQHTFSSERIAVDDKIDQFFYDTVLVKTISDENN